MSKDYANKNKFKPPRKLKQERKFVPVAAAIFAVICFVTGIVYLLHASQQSTFFSKEHVTSWFDRAKTFVSHKEKPVIKTVASQKTQAPHDEIQFDFYTELPNMQVNLPASAQLKAFPTPEHTSAIKNINKTIQVDHLAGQIDDSIRLVMAQQVANTTKKQAAQFVVQVGEFKDQVNASQMRLSLLLAGIETEIVKIAEHKYRVQQGPYASERQAKVAQRKLGQKGFEGLVKSL